LASHFGCNWPVAGWAMCNEATMQACRIPSHSNLHLVKVVPLFAGHCGHCGDCCRSLHGRGNPSIASFVDACIGWGML
jgi:hypothetical protein